MKQLKFNKSNFPISADLKIKSMINHLGSKNQCDSVGLLLDVMVYSQSDSEYQTRLVKYLETGSTIELRELCTRYGNYLTDLNFSNRVDAIDSAMLVALQPLPTNTPSLRLYAH
jgi:hypothetical protein